MLPLTIVFFSILIMSALFALVKASQLVLSEEQLSNKKAQKAAVTWPSISVLLAIAFIFSLIIHITTSQKENINIEILEERNIELEKRMKAYDATLLEERKRYNEMLKKHIKNK